MALLALASIVMMYADHRQHHLEGIRAGLQVMVMPIQFMVHLPFAISHWAQESLSTHTTLLETNRQLRHQQTLQESRLQKLFAFEEENRRLRALLQSSQRDWEQVLIAEILTVDFDPFKHLIQINKGSSDGVFTGHPILDAHGVMGQVIHVGPFSSTAILLTDPNHAIPVRVNRTGLRAIAMGTGQAEELEIPHIPNSADLRVGDLLVSSGLGMRFPSGYPVARISAITLNPAEPYATITATPIAHLTLAREVLLVWNTSQINAP